MAIAWVQVADTMESHQFQPITRHVGLKFRLGRLECWLWYGGTASGLLSSQTFQRAKQHAIFFAHGSNIDFAWFCHPLRTSVPYVDVFGMYGVAHHSMKGKYTTTHQFQARQNSCPDFRVTLAFVERYQKIPPSLTQMARVGRRNQLHANLPQFGSRGYATGNGTEYSGRGLAELEDEGGEYLGVVYNRDVEEEVRYALYAWAGI